MKAKHKPKTEPHIRHMVELLKSPAMWALSRTAHKILMYVECQGAKLAGKKNGKVPITYEDLEAQGLHTNSIAPALNEIHALGVAEVKRGRGGNAEFRRPNFIRLTYLPSGENWRSHQRTNGKRLIPSKKPKKSPSRLAPKNPKPPSERKCGRPHPQKESEGERPQFSPSQSEGHRPRFPPSQSEGIK
jgi:hypothetical protein